MEKEIRRAIVGTVAVMSLAVALITCMAIDEQEAKNNKPPTQPKIDEDPLVAPVESASQAEPQFYEYEIKKGDTLSELSERFYKNWVLYPSIARANGITDPNKIYAGDTIKIPKYIRHNVIRTQGGKQMLWTVVGFVVGLVVGWNFLPQPEAVKNFVDGLKSKLGL